MLNEKRPKMTRNLTQCSEALILTTKKEIPCEDVNVPIGTHMIVLFHADNSVSLYRNNGTIISERVSISQDKFLNRTNYAEYEKPKRERTRYYEFPQKKQGGGAI